MQKEKIKNKYLVIHGHFYQPPRENPWLEEIETQRSAYPFHDWNERINAECYKPNAFSKIFGKDSKIIKMVNNYSRISFNFGPTLMSWMEKYDKETYEKIIEADKISIKNFNGHGNAIAQVYNHIIMPLADEKDKETQIKWGIFDFKKRFGRVPEGMWLAETAIDYKTMEVMIKNGIKYTILSPYQASKIKKSGEEEWEDVLGGKIDARRPYRCYSKENPEKYLDIFFYDGPISNSIGFEDTVLDSSRYMNRLKMAFNLKNDEVQIVSVATDGETYGHHKKFSDLTLTHLVFELAEKEGIEVINYGAFLEKYPPQYEVILNEGKGEGTSWSCAHGVDRWKDDCGCGTGMNRGWNQKWRKPLREALNILRDKLKRIYESEGKKYLKDVWKARNNYIEVILDRNIKTEDEFFKNEVKAEVDYEERIVVLKLMEMQRNAQLMFTSCGWFFDDISGIETQQILMYAAKAVQLAQEFTNEDLENIIVEELKKGQSNLNFMGNGKELYEKHIKTMIVDFDKVAAHYAITSLFEDYSEKEKIYTYEIEKEDTYKVVEGSLTLSVGKIKIKNMITSEYRNMVFGVLRFGSMDFRCSVKNVFSNSEYIHIKKEILSKIENRFSIVESMRGIDIAISSNYYTFKDLLLEEKRKILTKVTNKFFDDYKNMYEKIYLDSARVVEALREAGLYIPEEYRISAEYTLSNKLKEIALRFLDNMNINIFETELSAIVTNAKRWNYSLKKDNIEKEFKEKLNEIVIDMKEITKEKIEKIWKLYRIANILEVNINTNYAQFKIYTLGKAEYKKMEDGLRDMFTDVMSSMGFLKESFE
ncbi:MAG: Glycosyl hydrolase family 57 [bacterium ADurb.Bin363]|nr:MAG: Glycosyl hydrolase family 57 [bacterium ADurb.Bin363]